jgi:hypothetical protein
MASRLQRLSRARVPANRYAPVPQAAAQAGSASGDEQRQATPPAAAAAAAAVRRPRASPSPRRDPGAARGVSGPASPTAAAAAAAGSPAARGGSHGGSQAQPPLDRQNTIKAALKQAQAMDARIQRGAARGTLDPRVAGSASSLGADSSKVSAGAAATHAPQQP